LAGFAEFYTHRISRALAGFSESRVESCGELFRVRHADQPPMGPSDLTRLMPTWLGRSFPPCAPSAVTGSCVPATRGPMRCY
jgi:hypothetical protein